MCCTGCGARLRLGTGHLPVYYIRYGAAYFRRKRYEQAREAGAQRVVTNADRPSTIAWYQRHFGYRRVGEVRKLHEFGLPDVDRWTTLEASLR